MRLLGPLGMAGADNSMIFKILSDNGMVGDKTMGITRQEIDTILQGLDNDIARRKKGMAVEKSAPKTSYVAKTSVSVPKSISYIKNT